MQRCERADPSQLEILELLVQRAPRQLAKCMPDIIPVMAEAIWDTKADVKKAARAALTNVCQLVSNKDIEKVRAHEGALRR